MSYINAANHYIDGVNTNEIKVGKLVRLCFERHNNDLVKSADPSYPYKFDLAKGERVCKFIELLTHVKGKWAGTKLKLEPWQLALTILLFGWVNKQTGLRRFRIAYFSVPRKNGKSIWAAAIALYFLVADGERGAEIYSGATTLKQAKEVFAPARQMVVGSDELRTKLGITANAQSLVCEATGSKFEPIIGRGKDGSSPSLFVQDEYHQSDSDELLDSQVTGMGARQQPLALITTTAGYNTAGPCKLLQDEVVKVLTGVIERDELFGLVYGLDDTDEWTSEAALLKANPNAGISVDLEFLRSQQKIAIGNGAKQNDFLIKHMNKWVQASVAWLPIVAWNKCAGAKIEDFIGAACWLGLDVATKIDLTAVIRLFRKEIDGKTHYYLFPKFYLPEERASDPKCQHYQKWVHEGELIAMEGSTIDNRLIAKDLIEDTKRFAVKELDFDQWEADYVTQEFAETTGVPIFKVPQSPQYLSDPAKTLEQLVLEGRLHHDGNPVMTWCVSNVVAQYNSHDNLVLDRDRKENKIDGVDATLNALYRCLATPMAPQYQKYQRIVMLA